MSVLVLIDSVLVQVEHNPTDLVRPSSTSNNGKDRNKYNDSHRNNYKNKDKNKNPDAL